MVLGEPAPPKSAPTPRVGKTRDPHTGLLSGVAELTLWREARVSARAQLCPKRAPGIRLRTRHSLNRIQEGQSHGLAPSDLNVALPAARRLCSHSWTGKEVERIRVGFIAFALSEGAVTLRSVRNTHPQKTKTQTSHDKTALATLMFLNTG